MLLKIPLELKPNYLRDPENFLRDIACIPTDSTRPFIRSKEKINKLEAYTKERARRGLYVSRSLPAGHVLTDEDILIIRPPNSISADKIDTVVGKKIKHDLSANDPLSLEILS